MRPSRISWIFFFFQTGGRGLIALLPKLIDPVNLALEWLAAQKHKASAETSMETQQGESGGYSNVQKHSCLSSLDT